MRSRSVALPCALLAGSLALAACSSLLPRTETIVKTEWGSFDEAKAAIEYIQAHKTSRKDLHAAGLDPYVNPNVELLNYSDVLRRFPLSGSVTRLDTGLRECLEAGKSCTGYSIAIDQQHKDRVGPFLLDLLSFRRETKNTGWTFNAVVLMVGDDVVYALYGGKPAISETETTVEPLGPLQNWNASGLVR
jgi:hypothetical protein